mgnify:CR=1 FL=1
MVACHGRSAAGVPVCEQLVSLGAAVQNMLLGAQALDQGRGDHLGDGIDAAAAGLGVADLLQAHLALHARAGGDHQLTAGDGHLRGFAHGDGPLRDGLCDRLNVDSLKVFFIHACPRGLPGDAQDRDGIGDG